VTFGRWPVPLSPEFGLACWIATGSRCANWPGAALRRSAATPSSISNGYSGAELSVSRSMSQRLKE
jgi:hypothetical protein